MIVRSLRLLTLASVIALVSPSAMAADLATYREFTLGTSTADVLALSGAASRDVRTVHERPSLLQELSWRPPYQSDPNDRDSVGAIAFSFVDNQLFKMVVDYDKDRTEGLTREDMISSLSAIYGPRSTLPAPASAKSDFESLDRPLAVARWRQGDVMIVLNHSLYSGGFGLTITSIKLDALATKAQASAIALDTREAPAREAARAKADAEARRAAEEKTRTTNKGTFKP